MNTNETVSLMVKPARCSTLPARINRLSAAAALAVCAAVLGLRPAAASIYYWDNNSSTPGFGTAGGTWTVPTPGPMPGWTTDATGGSTPASITTTTGDAVNFGSTTAGLGAGTVTLSGALSSSNITFAAASGVITLSGGTSLTLPAIASITVSNSSDTIATQLAGAATSLTKLGTGTLVLDNVNDTLTGVVNVNAGALTLNNGALSLGASALGVGSAASQRAVFNMVNGSFTNSATERIGSGGSSIGVINQSGGSFAPSGSLDIGDNVASAVQTNYGAYLISGGVATLADVRMSTANSTVVAPLCSGYFSQTGGTVVSTAGFAIARDGGWGVMDISGGNFNRSASASSQIYLTGFLGNGGVGQLTLRGAGTMDVEDASGLYFCVPTKATVTTGTVNLLPGGTLISKVGFGWGNTGVGSIGYVNFNGGLLQASGSSANYFSNWSGAYVFSGGANIDSQSNNISIAQPLLVPSGNGVASITGGTGSGYLAPPIVEISGDGTGAVAIAQLDPTGNMTNILVSSPGVNYSTASVSFVGGGGSASGYTVNIAPNSTTGGLTKLGSGTLTLAGAGTYQGATRVGNGTLAIAAANYPNTSALTLSNGTALNLDVTGGGSSLATPGLTLNTNTTLNLAYGTLPSGNPTAAAVSVSGVLNASGTNIAINITGSGFTVGQFPLITYSGSIGGNGYSAFQLIPLPQGTIATLSNNAANSSIDLVVTGSSQQVWKGLVNGQWDASTVNWVNANSGTPQPFLNGLPTLLDDTVSGPGGTSLTLVGSLQPASVLFNNSSLNYSLAGAGSLSGAMALTMSGTGTTTITTSNSYTGGTVINAGTLQLGDGVSASGYVAGGINVHSTLVLANPGTQTNSYSITNGGNVDVIGPGTQSITGAMSGSGALYVDGTASGAAVLAGTNSFAGLTSVTNNGRLTLADVRTGPTGILHVYSGTMNIQSGDFTCGGIENGYGSTGNDGNSAVNHSTGNVSFTSATFELVMGVQATSGLTETYNLTGGSLVGFASTTHGVILGQASCDPGNPSTATFNLSGSGFLNMSNATLAIGRADAQANNWNANFNQSGGNAAFGSLNMGGSATGSQNIHASLSLSGGTFAAGSFASLSAGLGNVSTIYIGGTANVTLPAFPALGSGTATITFDGGSLSPFAASTTYLQGLNNAYVTANGATFNVANGNNITVAQALTDAPSQTGGKLIKAGVGTLTLTGANTYSGTTTVNNGALVVNEAFAASGNVTVASGATLGCFSDTPGASVNLSSITLGAANSGLLAQFSGNTGNPTAPAGNITSLTLNGVTSVSLSCRGIQVGTIPLFQYTTLSGSGSLTLGSVPQGVVGTITNNISTKIISLVVSSIVPLVWSGANGTNWDINLSTNWVLNASPATYQDGALTCLFNDTAVNTNVTITQVVSPQSVVFSNNTLAYNLGTSGSGVLTGGTGITKAGAGTAVLSGTNTYTGSTVINNGALQIGANSTSGSISASSPITIGANGTLVYNSVINDGFGNNISGTGTFNQAALNELGLTGSNSFSGTINIQNSKVAFAGALSASGQPNVNISSGATLSVGAPFASGTATIGNLTGAGRVDAAFSLTPAGTRTLQVNQTTDGLFSGPIIDASNGRVIALTKAGPAVLTLAGPSAYSGPTTVNQGTLIVSGVISNTTVTVNSGAAFGGGGIATGTVSFQTGSAATNSVGTPLTVGTLDMAGNAAMNVATASPLTSGLYPLINFTSQTSSGQFTSLAVGGAGLASGATASVVVTNSTIALSVIGGSAPPPVSITNSHIGNTLVLNWPAGQGWQLQTQTNGAHTGITTNWVTVPGAVPPFTNIINPAASSVFYRLKY